MIQLILKEVESSTETNSYCMIVADSVPKDIASIFAQNAYLYAFGKASFWNILSHDSIHISWEIGMEYVDVSCEHIIRQLLKNNSTISVIEITNTVMGIINYQRTLYTLQELDYRYEFVNEEIGDIDNPQPTENGKPIL